MRKTIDLTEQDIDKITEYQKRNGLKNFSDAIRNIIRNANIDEQLGDENFALIADAIKIMDEKIDSLIANTAPRSAGEVK